MKHPGSIAALLSSAFLISACSSDPVPTEKPDPKPTAKTETAPDKKPDTPVVAEAPKAVPLTDDQRATALWEKIRGFRTWSNPPGFDGLVEGDSVHGDYVRIYANATALTDMTNLPNGSIVVKEGFHDDEGDLKALTVMEKVEGFSEDSGDWFFSRFDTAGTPSKVNSNSCIRCHRKADDGDFSFAND